MKKKVEDSKKEIAQERIEILFEEARKQALKGRMKLCNKYVFVARKISGKSKAKIPTELRRKFCHKCYHYLYPGINCSVRTNKRTKAVEWTCADCKHINRYPYIKEQKARK